MLVMSAGFSWLRSLHLALLLCAVHLLYTCCTQRACVCMVRRASCASIVCRYKEKGVWRLALIWPVLLIASPRFREQFFNAVRGIKSRVTNTDSQDSVRSQDSL